MTLNTYIAGDPASGHDLAGFVTRRADAVHDKATAWHDARSQAESDWEGAASEAFVANRAGPNARDTDALADIDRALAAPLTAWGDGIRAAKNWMDQAKQVARDAELAVTGDLIFPPKAFSHPEPVIAGPDSPSDVQAKAAFDEAKALHAKKQAAFDEAKELVRQARELERKSHDELRDVLTRQTEAIKQLGQFKQWSEAAASATMPAATGLMALATDLENKSVHATQAAFEKAAAQGPQATNSMWSVLTSEQRADLIDRHPRMVGNTNGIPAVDRDVANRSILDAQRQALVDEIKRRKREYQGKADSLHPRTHSDTEELKQALAGIGEMRAKLGENASESGYYLLGLDSTANDGRGTAIIAHGNPDTAHNTMTLVPGTSSDLGDVGNYLAHNDKVLNEANAMSPDTNNVAITWSSYESPLNLPLASDGSYADAGNAGFSEFQEGLRVTHQGDVPSHNTVVGHSYGSTFVGEASANGGTHADDLVFLGSPGVSVDHANQLDVPNDHVWGGTSSADDIHMTVDPTTVFTDTDDHWFGMNPSDPAFGGKVLPTDPSTEHGEYWDKRESREGLARVMTTPHQGVNRE